MTDFLLNLIGTDESMWVVIVLQFFAVEFRALFNKERGDTWSEVLRYVFGFSKRAANGDITRMQSWGMRARRGSFWALAAWFTAHIGLGL